MTKEEKALLPRIKIGAIIVFGLNLIDKETFVDLMRFEKLPHERQEELCRIIEDLIPKN